MNTELLFVIDRSGSMSSIERAACEGFNSFIEEQRSVPGEARVSVTFFNSQVVHSFTFTPIRTVTPMMRLQVGGMTAMYDGIGQAIDLHAPRIARERWADNVIVVIITDGAENSSRTHTKARVAGMIQETRSAGWQFVFLGANIDVSTTARGLNIDESTSYAFTASNEGVRSVYAQASATTRAMRSWGL